MPGLAITQWRTQNSAIIMELLDEQRNLERFTEMVLGDHQLHAQLRAVPDEMAFTSLVIRLAADRGCHFTAGTVQAALNEKRRAWLERWL